MSTRPYATHGGLRIRQCYNKAVIRYREWQMHRRPTGATTTEWRLWQHWVHLRETQMLADRDALINQARDNQRRTKRNGRNSERRNGSAASAASR